MRIYAVLSNDGDNNDVLNERNYQWVLTSFKATKDLRTSLTTRPKLILDSGAFSVWQSGMTVDLDELLSWAKAIVEHYAPGEVWLVNLDVIPGSINVPPTPAERLRAAAESAENAELIRAAGLAVIEVYHRYEPLSVFEAILDRRRPGELVDGEPRVAAGQRGVARDAKAVDGRQPIPAVTVAEQSEGGIAERELVRRAASPADKTAERDSSTWFRMRQYNLHVRTDGTTWEGNRATAPRTTRRMSQLFAQRRLNLWLRRSAELSTIWESRGVRFNP